VLAEHDTETALLSSGDRAKLRAFAEMKMKELCASDIGRQVEFIGVGLDRPENGGALDNLKKFVAKDETAGHSIMTARPGRARSSRSLASAGILPSF
jgi:hypothetical protein